MRLKKAVTELADIKIILSVVGAFCVSTGFLLSGHIIWLFASTAWLKYFYDLKDDNAVVMYWIWVLQAIVGIIYYGLIV